jgi:hypothetical protein
LALENFSVKEGDREVSKESKDVVAYSVGGDVLGTTLNCLTESNHDTKACGLSFLVRLSIGGRHSQEKLAAIHDWL